jgi:phytoene dehydrogenase-like protein
MTATFDLTVIGADEASFSAAAVAARTGASVAIIRPRKRKNMAATYCDMPNFVWRRLDLHEYGLSLERISARVTLGPDGATVTTHEGVRETQAALAQEGKADHLLWADFVDEMKALEAGRRLRDAATAAPKNGAAGFSLFSGGVRDCAALGQATGSCAAALDDYLGDDALKTHIAAHALGPSGLGGGEPGSALALSEFFDAHAWRVRPDEGGPSLLSTLETACKDSGVEFFTKDLTGIAREGARHVVVSLADGETIKTRYVLFASPGAALKAGMRASACPLAGHGAATAVMRIALKRPMPPAAQDDKAVFQVLDGAGDLQIAREAALDGRLPDNLPVEFEYAANGDIIVRTAYCPAAFRDDEGWREWTGQDRQAAARRMIDQLARRIPEFSANVRKTKIEVIGAASPDRPPVFAGPDFAAGMENVIIQPNRHNAVAAAVQLVDRMLAGE